MLTKVRSVLLLLFVCVATGLHAQADQLKDSAAASLEWLGVIDKGNYQEAWNTGSLSLRLKIPIQYWLQIMNATRKPLGQVSNRQMVEQKPSKNPAGLPAGDYMVIVYKSDFTAKKGATELVTLVQESDGKWRGLTYMVSE